MMSLAAIEKYTYICENMIRKKTKIKEYKKIY